MDDLLVRNMDEDTEEGTDMGTGTDGDGSAMGDDSEEEGTDEGGM